MLMGLLVFGLIAYGFLSKSYLLRDSNRQVTQTSSDGSLLPPHKNDTKERSAEFPIEDRVAGRGKASRERLVSRAQDLAQQGSYAEAVSTLKQVLLLDPQDCEAIFILASVLAESGRVSDGIDALDSIPTHHPEAGLAALGQSADWCMQLKRFDDAEQRYSEVLRRAPAAFQARRQLAFIFNCQGRRQEAAEQIRELCKLGNVRQDELHSLVALSHAMFNDPSEAGLGQGNAYFPIGRGGQARKLFTDGNFTAAAEVLRQDVASGEATAAIVALYGRIVTEGQQDDAFFWWLSHTNQETKRFADYWAALGTFLISQRRFEEATHALLQAMDRDPTDLNSAGRLIQAFSTLGNEEASQRWVKQWAAINESLKANNRVSATANTDPNDIAALAVALEELHRPLESLVWKSLESHYRGMAEEEGGRLNAMRIALVKSGQGFPSRSQRLCDFDPADFKTPELSEFASARHERRAPRAVRTPLTPAIFVNVASQLGLQHSYQVASKPQAFGFAIYQTLGGAAVVLDYDLDGKVDLYLTQGGCDPPEFRGDLSDLLWRQVDDRLTDTTSNANASEWHYSTGATAGDWNQDGFPDVVVANLGHDVLMINNGDGTFSSRALNQSQNQWSLAASIAMADLTDDHLPDLCKLIYIDDPDLARKPRFNHRGEVVEEVLPFDFQAGLDQVYVNDSAGGARLTHFSDHDLDHRLGLGLVVTDFNRQPGNEVFVGNDVHADQMWVRHENATGWVDVAPSIGCAFGVRGSKTASMGIAAGDVDRSGTIDLHVTNFQERNSSLFINLGDAFLERNVEFGMAEASQSVLGWGTQAIDYDNDNRLDLLVTNGHVEKAITIKAPFEQPVQLFANRGNRFEVIDVEDPSGYWSAQHLGRALARLDFNRDGRMDFVVTHLGESSALMLNQTSASNHWLQLQLVGTVSERDAIGAKIEIVFDGHRSTEWVIAGDGYLCKNEPIISFGLLSATEVDQMWVTWPTGTKQVFQGIAANQRLLVIEGEPALYPLR